MHILDFYMQYLGIRNPALLERLMAVTQVRSLFKRDLFVRAGERQNQMAFLISGVLRGFYLDVNGREITDCFGVRYGTAVVSGPDLKRPASLSIEAITDCELFVLPLDVLRELIEENLELLKIYNRYLQEALDTHWETKTVICQRTAMQRYCWFLNAYPGLVDQISNKYVASFLGMTPVTLSRLRRELREGRKE